MADNKQKSSKKLSRSARMKERNRAARTKSILRARNNHIKRATQSCGEKFAADLRAHYARVGLDVGRKVARRRH